MVLKKVKKKIEKKKLIKRHNECITTENLNCPNLNCRVTYEFKEKIKFEIMKSLSNLNSTLKNIIL